MVPMTLIIDLVNYARQTALPILLYDPEAKPSGPDGKTTQGPIFLCNFSLLEGQIEKGSGTFKKQTHLSPQEQQHLLVIRETLQHRLLY